MQKGIVKWFDDIKGYGYIKPEDGNQIFVHFTDIEQNSGFRSLSEGDMVTFELIDGDLGAKAINVRIVKKA